MLIHIHKHDAHASKLSLILSLIPEHAATHKCTHEDSYIYKHRDAHLYNLILTHINAHMNNLMHKCIRAQSYTYAQKRTHGQCYTHMQAHTHRHTPMCIYIRLSKCAFICSVFTDPYLDILLHFYSKIFVFPLVILNFFVEFFWTTELWIFILDL